MKEAIIDYNVQRNADQVYATIGDKKYLHNDPNSSCRGEYRMNARLLSDLRWAGTKLGLDQL